MDFLFPHTVLRLNESFFYRDVEFDRTRPYVSSLKECFFENDFLTWFYKQVNVVCVTSQYTLVPAAVFQEKQKAGLLAFTFSSPEGRCLSNELKRRTGGTGIRSG